MAHWGIWAYKAGTVGSDGWKLGQASQSLEQACLELAQTQNPTPEQRAAVTQASEAWANSLGKMGGNVAQGIPVPLLSNALGGFINNLQQSPAFNQSAEALSAIDQLEKAGTRESASIERGLCRAAGEKLKLSKITPTPPPRRDPLALDLDGDGVETIAASAGTLFDHDGNGIKTASGWVKGDDGLLVLDRNGNGAIDNGSELFGVDTVLVNGQKAADGFQALSELDSNGDGRIDAADAAFQNLKVWRDIDQDGVSQADEMFSLAAVGIDSISLARTTATQDLGNGNQITAAGSFTRTDGTSGAIANLALAEDRFNSEFVDAIPLSAEAAALPSMSGMGLVRSLSEAAMLSPALLDVLSQYAAATTVYEQRNLLDQLVGAWAGTAVAPSQSVHYEFAGIQHYVNNDPLTGETQAYQAMLGKLHALEIFNADSFVASGITAATLQASQVVLLNQGYDALKSGIYDSLISQTLLKPYFDAISFVDGDTPHLDYSATIALLDLKINANASAGLAEVVDLYRLSGGFFKTTGWNIDDYFGSAISAHPVDSALSAVLTTYGIAVGGAGNDVLQSTATLSTVFGGDGNDSMSGGTENATLYGGDGNDTITDGNGSDTIECGAGDDIITDQGSGTNVLRGGDGNDTVNFSYAANNTVEGGAGNDLLQMSGSSNSSAYSNTFAGGLGNDRLVSGGSADTYLFNRGDGQDTIVDLDTWGNGKLDKIVFGAGIAVGDLALSRIGYNLVVKINDPSNPTATDQITIENWFSGDLYQIETFQCADGGSLTKAQISQLGNVLYGTASADTLTGWSDNNTILGLAGNDTITDGGGNNVIDGGTGDDTMRGGAGNDTYLVDSAGDLVTEYAGEGTDLVQASATYTLAINVENLTLTGTAAINGNGNTLANVMTGNAAANTLNGGAGTDSLIGGAGNDTFVLGLGYGSDIVQENDATAGNTDAAEFLAGIAAEQIWLRQIGNNLEASIIGTSDKLTMQNWYLGSQYHIEQFHTADGKLLLDSQVENLVQAMAAFAPPGAGQTTLPPAYQEALAPVIAANWQ